MVYICLVKAACGRVHGEAYGAGLDLPGPLDGHNRLSAAGCTPPKLLDENVMLWTASPPPSTLFAQAERRDRERKYDRRSCWQFSAWSRHHSDAQRTRGVACVKPYGPRCRYILQARRLPHSTSGFRAARCVSGADMSCRISTSGVCSANIVSIRCKHRAFFWRP